MATLPAQAPHLLLSQAELHSSHHSPGTHSCSTIVPKDILIVSVYSQTLFLPAPAACKEGLSPSSLGVPEHRKLLCSPLLWTCPSAGAQPGQADSELMLWADDTPHFEATPHFEDTPRFEVSVPPHGEPSTCLQLP